MSEAETIATSAPLQRDAEGRPVYRNRPKVVGYEMVFTLETDHLAWTNGRSSGRLDLAEIDYVRLVFRPANFYLRRYRLDIRQRLGGRAWFSNVSWRGMAEIEANDAEFAAFTRALLAAVAKTSPKARFLAGEPAWRYGFVALTTLGIAAAVAVLAIQALIAVNWPLMAVVTFVGGYVIWQMGLWLSKNRPATMDPLSPPAAVLPDVSPGTV